MVGTLLERCTFPPAGSHLDCAVSGGADSLALLVLATAAECEVTAWHVDHGLRAGSAEEAEIVRSAAARFEAGFETRRAAVEPGPNLEARAREARRAALPPGAATGHTADDQAETVLLNLLRGSGLDGLAGMRPGPTHPILGLRRAETHKLCADFGLAPVADPSNDDQALRRNALRHTVLPLLDDLAGRDVPALIARQAALLADDADLLDELAAAIDPSDAAALVAAPVPLARRAIRNWLRPALSGRPPSAAAVDRVLAVARCEAKGAEVTEGVRVDRSRGRLMISTA
ncbi:MAG TPA: tRNA lysidine(34) synthetase TilS [Acidimicrobiales bacterium]|nr:tRNA lysidine(34) synthetase TilS [Acidimicrobiales bacterium]